MSEIMLKLSEEWGIGYIVTSCIVCLIYLLYSILLIKACRKIKYDVRAGGMLPIINIVILFKYLYYRHYSKHQEDEEVLEW